jgi:hypothetical protein
MNFTERIQPAVGFGLIMDGATYSEDAVFKQQMDSAGLI